MRAYHLVLTVDWTIVRLIGVTSMGQPPAHRRVQPHAVRGQGHLNTLGSRRSMPSTVIRHKQTFKHMR